MSIKIDINKMSTDIPTIFTDSPAYNKAKAIAKKYGMENTDGFIQDLMELQFECLTELLKDNRTIEEQAETAQQALENAFG